MKARFFSLILIFSLLSVCGATTDIDTYFRLLNIDTNAVYFVTNGMVFIDGEYIPPPYTIRRKGGAVVLNDRVFMGSVIPPPPLPARQPNIPPETDPKLPDNVTKKTIFQNHVVQKYLKELTTRSKFDRILIVD